MRHKYSFIVPVLVLVLLSSCAELAPFQPLAPTATAIPSIASQYSSMDCSSWDVPDRATSQECYWIDRSSNSFGIVYYNGHKPNAVGTFVTVSSPVLSIDELSQMQSDFIIHVAKVGGWDLYDLQNIFLAMSDWKFGDTKTFGDLIATVDHDALDGYEQLIVHVGVWP